MKLLLIILGVLFALILLPFLILGGLFLLVAGGSSAARRTLDRLRKPNGILDGRRNVRVVIPQGHQQGHPQGQPEGQPHDHTQ